MYKLICQLFLSITGNNFPEEVFDVLFPLLQGERTARKEIGLGINDYSNQTPHQILLCDIPLQYYQTWEQFLVLKKKMKSSRFKNRYYLDRQTIKCHPVWSSRRIWIDKVYGEKMVGLNYILYMDSEKDKKIVLNNINTR